MFDPDWEERLLDAIHLPRIAPRQVSIGVFGARSGTAVPQTAAIQAAIDSLSVQGGGRVIVPSGRFLTGSLQLKSGVELCLSAPDAVLAFSTQTDEEHYPLTLVHWEGTPCYNYSPLIYAIDAEDISITGPGLLDGQASEQAWWCWHHQTENAWASDGRNLQKKARMALRQMNIDGVPVAQRRFGDGSYLRPNFIQLLRCRRVLLNGFSIRRSPMWQVNPVLCESITMDGLSLESYGPNSDGIDPESCTGVLIQHCRFATGDDCISLKSGRDRDGREASTPCQNVLIRHNLFADGHGGIALGSEASGGIRNVIAHHNHFDSPNLTYALRLKTNARRGGVMENIWFHDCSIRSVGGAAIHGTMLYEDGRQGSHLPVFRNIAMENITAHGGQYGIFLEAFREVPITGLVLRHIRINGAVHALRAMNWQHPVMEDVRINGMCFPRPTQVRILGLPLPGGTLRAQALGCGEELPCTFRWLLNGIPVGEGASLRLPDGCAGAKLMVTAVAGNGEANDSRPYTVLARADASPSAARLRCRGFQPAEDIPADAPITRRALARLLHPFAQYNGSCTIPQDVAEADLPCVLDVIGSQLLALRGDGSFDPQGHITRREMATVAMQACGVSYRNASTTMPDCTDAQQVGPVYGTNVARALYFGFQSLDEQGAFRPMAAVTWGEALDTLNLVADFAGF